METGSGGSIAMTDGNSTTAISASSGSGNVTVTVDGDIESDGDNAIGIRAESSASAPGSAVSVNLAGQLEMTGSFTSSFAGAIAIDQSSSDAEVEITGEVHSTGQGLFLFGADDSGSTIDINVAATGVVDAQDHAIKVGDGNYGHAGDTAITNHGTISSASGHAIDVFRSDGHNRIVTFGDISADATQTDAWGNPVAAIWGGEGQESVDVNDGTVDGTIHLGGGDDNLWMAGGAIKGAVYMGYGADFVWFGPGADLTQLTVLDGEGPAQKLPSCASDYFAYCDDGSTPDREENQLGFANTLTGSTTGAGNGGAGAPGNALIANWDGIEIGGDMPGRLNLTGDINDGRGDGSLGDLHIGPGSTLALAAGTALSQVDYHVSNDGTIDLTAGSTAPDGKMVIRGDYHGAPEASQLRVKGQWDNPDAQHNDHLVIEGNAEGRTQVTVPGGIVGDVTLGQQPKNGGWDDPVVTVKGTDSGPDVPDSDGFTFYGTADTINAGQAQLAKNGDSYYWTLEADPNAEPEPGPDPKPEADPVPILIPGAPGYIQMSRINREMGLQQLGTLHERVGEEQTWAWDDCGTMCADYRERKAAGEYTHPYWIRVGGGQLKEQGEERFGYKTRQFFLQVGTDVHVQTDEARNHRHIGVMATYSHGEHDFYDKYRSRGGVVIDDKHVGNGTTDLFSLGGYATWFRTNGAYLDLVANVSTLRNKYESASGEATQHGYGLGVSAEVGRPWRLGQSHWQIEPQAQLAYQYVRLSDFDDDVRNIDEQSDGTLRGRIGTRLAWNNDDGYQRTNTFYLKANLLYDFDGYKSEADIGSDHLKEEFHRFWGELGIGGQVPLGSSAYLFGDIGYQHSLAAGDNNIYRQTGTPREGVNGHLGFRYSW